MKEPFTGILTKCKGIPHKGNPSHAPSHRLQRRLFHVKFLFGMDRSHSYRSCEVNIVGVGPWASKEQGCGSVQAACYKLKGKKKGKNPNSELATKLK
jgi:hypothetical protein